MDLIEGLDNLNLYFHMVKGPDSCSVNKVGLIMVSFSLPQYLYSYRNIFLIILIFSMFK